MVGDKRAYWELLQDPRWQQKRLRIMERDEFACHGLITHQDVRQIREIAKTKTESEVVKTGGVSHG